DPPVLELDGFPERAADAHDHAALDLVAQPVGVDDRAAVERREDADDADAAGGAVDGDLGARSDVAAFFDAAGEADAVAGGRLPAGPAEALRGGLEDGAESRVPDVAE